MRLYQQQEYDFFHELIEQIIATSDDQAADEKPQRVLVLRAVEREVRHVPVAAALELHDVLGLARGHVVVVIAEPVVALVPNPRHVVTRVSRAALVRQNSVELVVALEVSWQSNTRRLGTHGHGLGGFQGRAIIRGKPIHFLVLGFRAVVGHRSRLLRTTHTHHP